MKVISILTSMTALLLILTSCEQNEAETPQTSGPEILLSSSLQPLTVTRTATQEHLTSDGIHFTAGQHIALFIKGTDANSAYQGGIHLMTTEENDVLKFDVGSNCYWPGSNTVNFYAWCPYTDDGPFAGKTSNDEVTFKVDADQSTPEMYAANDLLYAQKTASNPNDGSRTLLTFSHKLAQVIVVLKSEDGNITSDQLNSATVTIEGNLQMDALVDIDGGTAKAIGTATQTTVKLGVGATTFCVLPPGQSLNGTTIRFALADGGTQTYTVQSIGTLEAEKKYTITLNLKLYGIQSFEEKVEPWVSGEDDREQQNPLYI